MEGAFYSLKWTSSLNATYSIRSFPFSSVSGIFTHIENKSSAVLLFNKKMKETAEMVKQSNNPIHSFSELMVTPINWLIWVFQWPMPIFGEQCNRCWYHVVAFLHLIKYNNLKIITNETHLLSFSDHLFNTYVTVCIDPLISLSLLKKLIFTL